MQDGAALRRIFLFVTLWYAVCLLLAFSHPGHSALAVVGAVLSWVQQSQHCNAESLAALNVSLGAASPSLLSLSASFWTSNDPHLSVTVDVEGSAVSLVLKEGSSVQDDAWLWQRISLPPGVSSSGAANESAGTVPDVSDWLVLSASSVRAAAQTEKVVERQCFHPRSMCDPMFGNLAWLELQCVDAEGKLGVVHRSRVSSAFAAAVALGGSIEVFVPLSAACREVVVTARLLRRRVGEASAVFQGLQLRRVPRPQVLASQRLIKTPILRMGTQPSQVLVVWEVDSLTAASFVEYRCDAQTKKVLPSVTQIDRCHYLHTAVLDLSECRAARAVYRVHWGYGRHTSLHRFSLPSKASSLVLVGDNQYGARFLSHLLADRNVRENAILINVGDWVNNARLMEEYYSYLWRPMARYAAGHPTVLVSGNHDSEHHLAKAYSSAPPLPQWYSIALPGDLWLVVLDSNCPHLKCPQQTAWLQRTLDAVRSAGGQAIVLSHLPPFTELWDPKEGYNGEAWMREFWVPVFQSCPGTVVISGHTHAYLRGSRDKVHYIITGGGGGDLDEETSYDWGPMFYVVRSVHHLLEVRRVSPRTLHFTAVEENGSVMDEMVIKW